jgi:hypothetical protein
VCHIKGERLGSARFDPNQTDEERQSYDNLIVMCPTHHTVIDDDEDSYSPERLYRMKKEHEAGATSVAEDEAERLANSYSQTNANIRQSGGVAAQTLNATHFTINHNPPPSQGGREREQQAVERIWDSIEKLRQEFGSFVLLDSILTRDEIHNGYQRGWALTNFSYLDALSADNELLEIFKRVGANAVDRERPFVTRQTWNIFYSIRAIYGRYGYLLHLSSQNRFYHDWRTDEGMDQHLRYRLPSNFVDSLKQKSFGGIKAVIEYLEEEFIAEAGFRRG